MTALVEKIKKKRTVSEQKAQGFSVAFVILMLLVLLAPIFVPNTPISAAPSETEDEKRTSFAYSSWIQSDPSTKDEIQVQGTTAVGFADSIGMGELDFDASAFDPGAWLVNLLSVFFMFIGWLIDGLLSGGWGVVSDVNLSTDAIIYGRLKEGVNTNWVYFELVNNNIYGILGSTLYRFFTNVCYSVFVIVFMFGLIRQVGAGGDSKRKAEFKDMMEYSALMFLFLYLFPQIVDICIYLKDWFLLGTYNLFGKPDDEGIGGLARTWANLWFNGGDSHEGIFGAWYAVLYMGTVCASLFFVMDYVKTAIKQTILFGLSPVFFVLSIKNRRLLSNLVTEMFPNIFIPVFDAMLFLLPMGTARIAMAIGATHANGISGPLGLIILIMIWSIIPMRREILRLFGASGALGGSRGFGGIMAAAMMAMRMFGGKGSGITSGLGAGAEATAETNAELGKMYGEMAESMHGGEVGAAMLRNGSTGMESIAGDVTDAVQSQENSELAELASQDVEGIAQGAEETVLARGDEDFGTEISTGGFGNEISVDDFGNEVGVDFDNPTYSGAGVMEDFGGATPVDYGDEFINARGANLDNLQQLEGRQAELSGQAARLQGEIGVLESANKVDENTLRAYEHAVANPNSPDSAKYFKEPDHAEKMGQLRENVNARKEEIGAREIALQKTNVELSQVNKGIQGAREMESYYAKASKHTGASGETYNSAEFKRAMQLRDIKMKYANYKNFDSGHFKDVLTPEEKMRFYTERASKQRTEQAFRVAGKVAGITAGVGAGAVLAVGAMYGGPSAMATAGTIGGGLVGGAVTKATDGVGRAVVNHTPSSAASSTNTSGSNVVKPASNPVNDATAKLKKDIDDGRKVMQQMRNAKGKK